MGDRADEREVTVDAPETDDVGEIASLSAVDADRDEFSGTASRREQGIAARVRHRATQVFSPRAFGVRTVAFAAGGVLAGWLPVLGGALATLFAVLILAFLFGAVIPRRRYAEAGAAGALVVGLAGLLEFPTLVAFGLGLPAIVFAAGSGGLAALAGTYFGRDLRAGLTRDL